MPRHLSDLPIGVAQNRAAEQAGGSDWIAFAQDGDLRLEIVRRISVERGGWLEHRSVWPIEPHQGSITEGIDPSPHAAASRVQQVGSGIGPILTAPLDDELEHDGDQIGEEC